MMLCCGTAWAQDSKPIGKTAAVQRDVKGSSGAQWNPLKVGDALVFKESIAAGDRSAARANLIDGTVVTIGANSKLTLDEFVLANGGAKPAMVTELAQGVLRFVTGTLPKEAYSIRTTTAVAGVRGTVFDLIIESDGATDIYVEEGSVVFSNLTGASVTVTPGLASRVDARSGPPSPPAPPQGGLLAPVSAMTTELALVAPPVDVLPKSTVDRVGALAATAASLASQTSSDSPGGQLK
jgi:hypothetical protein